MAYKRKASLALPSAKRARGRNLFGGGRTRRSKWQRARTGLARFAYSRRRNMAGRRLSNMLNKIGETKLIACTQVNELEPTAIQTGAKAYSACFCMGTKPAAWGGTWQQLDGIKIEQGDTAQSRDGAYVYLDHTRLSFNIDTTYSTTYRPPTQFRVVVGKARRGTNPAGITQNPSTDLFIDEIGNAWGHATAGKNGTDLMLQPLNKRDWYVMSDRKFTLSTPLEDSAGGYTGKYPTSKNFVCRLPYAKKTKYGSSAAGALQDFPLDIDSSYFVCIYARSEQKDTTARAWEVNVRGTTCFKDI